MNKSLQKPSRMRYSNRPIEDYKTVVNGRTYGPASSVILCEPEAWNLAFLSHDFDECFVHSDPYFSTNVRRTVQSKLDGTGPDLASQYPATALVQSLLTLTFNTSLYSPSAISSSGPYSLPIMRRPCRLMVSPNLWCPSSRSCITWPWLLQGVTCMRKASFFYSVETPM